MTGPDEYTAVVDDNVYTNLMAEQNLFAAAEAAKRHWVSLDSADPTANDALRPGNRRGRCCGSASA